ncbi:MAG TPA: DNA primase [Burkholderiales bacterium]|nr:DNA primase [Burkholderiales bacterium]
MIPDSFKQDLLNRVDIVDVVQRCVQLRKAGANYVGLCPFHNEKTPSFSVSPTKQFYHCFGCGVHGNAIGFLMAYASLGYIDAVKDLASQVGMQVPESQPRSPEEAARREREPDLYALMEKAMDFYRAELKKSSRAIEYLKGRGLTGEIAARYRMGYAPDDWQALESAFPNYQDKTLVEVGLVIENEGKRYDRFRDRVMFPILNARGAVIGFGGRILDKGEPKYMNSPETPLFEKGRELYGLPQARDAIRAAGRVLVVEGYMDVVALAQFGVGYAVATLGTATTPVHVSKLLRLADELVFSFDGDAAGRKAAWRALEVSLALAPDHKPIRFLFLPEGDDPDSYVRKHGQAAFEARVGKAETLSQFLLAQLRAENDLATAEGRARFVSMAKPHIQKITAPALRLQLINEVAQLARVGDGEIHGLLELPRRPAFARASPRRPNYETPSSLEWSLLTALLSDLTLVEHIDPERLDPERAETQALLAIREQCEAAEEALSFPILMDALTGNSCLEMVLKSQKYGEDLGFDADAARSEFQHALTQIDIRQRKKELDELRGRLSSHPGSKEDLVVFNEKNLAYQRLRGALPSA